MENRPGNDCGAYCELLIAKFRLKLKKVEKNIRSFRYDYSVEVMNRFKGLDLLDSV